jgi:hypothetical protein
LERDATGDWREITSGSVAVSDCMVGDDDVEMWMWMVEMWMVKIWMKVCDMFVRVLCVPSLQKDLTTSRKSRQNCIFLKNLVSPPSSVEFVSLYNV